MQRTAAIVGTNSGLHFYSNNIDTNIFSSYIAYITFICLIFTYGLFFGGWDLGLNPLREVANLFLQF